MENIFKTIGKFWFPVLCIVVGIAMLVSAMSKVTPQPAEVKLGAACILAVGIFGLLFLLDVIKKPIRLVLLVISLLTAGYLFMQSSNSITSEIAEREQAKMVKDKTVQALKDVRSALEAYRVANGRYTQDLDELTTFVKSGTVPKPMRIGMWPDSIGTEENARELGLIQKMPEGMTIEQVKAQGIIVRDTVQIAVMEDKFDNEFAKKGRLYPFDIKNIKFSPVTNKPWDIKTGVANMGGVQQPVVEVKDPEPYKEEKQLKIGDLKEAHLNGNWDD